MSELNGLLERVKIFNLISFLLYGMDSALQTTKTYEERIEESYTQFFNDLKKLFPSANREDDNLYNIISNFSSTNNEIYLEMDLIVGLQLYKNLDEKKHDVSFSYLQSIINKNLQ